MADYDVEGVESRYNRKWLQLKDDRKVRGFDFRSEERLSREFVDPALVAETLEEVDGSTVRTVSGTVVTRFDNQPADYDSTALAERLQEDGSLPSDFPVVEEEPAPTGG